MSPDEERLRAELRACDDEINAAYWRFTRCRRGVPPVLAVPEAYARRAAIRAQLRALTETAQESGIV